MSLSLSLSLTLLHLLLLIPFLSTTISLLSILSSFNYVAHSLSPCEKCAEVSGMISVGPPGFCVSVRGRLIPRNWPSRPLLTQVLFKATCFITVEVRLNNTSNEQQIHNCQILIFSTSFFFFVFFSSFTNAIYVNCPEIQPS